MTAPLITLTRVGSSPLTRGKPRRGDKLADAGRLIPAHAGKTEEDAGADCAVQAHPRSRGENAVSAKVRSGS